ncbi:MAG: 1-phosphofructokinase family hexose kinase [Methylococcaceae bacterium]|nr:1-phosphofructokinase family hexose kinase [Methylococcaceae bacterium]
MKTEKSSRHPTVSLSLNPAIDLTYQVDSLIHDQKSRAASTYYDPGGTGINVGRALEKLNANSHTCCIIAGTMGRFLDSMLKQELEHITTLQVEGETRINTTILQHSPHRQYEINAAGPTITPQQLEQIIDQFLTICGQGIGILTGSLPPGISDETYLHINTKLKNQNAKAIIDAPIINLKKALSSNPFLIKPNLYELEVLQNKTLNSIEKIAFQTRIIAQQGTEYVCVSLGNKGAILTTPDNSFFCNSPQIKVISTVGSGDSMVAGLAHAFAQKKTPDQALKLAVACGAGTAKQKGTQLFNPDEIETIMKEINVRTLDI